MKRAGALVLACLMLSGCLATVVGETAKSGPQA